MKLLWVCITCVLAYVQCQQEVYPQENQLFKATWNNIVLKALQRKYPGYLDKGDDKCTETCQKFPPFPYAFWDFDKEVITTDYVVRLCRYYNTSTDCLRSCQDSQRKQYLKEISVPVKYFCEESNLVTDIPCLGNATIENAQTCKMSQCVEEGSESLNTSLTPKQLAVFGLNLNCKVLQCMINCTDPFRVAKCGKSANIEFQTLIKKVADSLENLRYLYFMSHSSAHDFTVDMPPNCKPCKFS